MNLEKYKAIIFDWDGTLVDTCGLILDAHNHVRAKYGHATWTMEHFLGQASKSAREYYPEVYGDQADEAQTILYNYVEAHHLNYIKPMEGAQDVFVALNHLPMGLVSNKRHQTLHIEVEFMNWKDHFDCIIGAGYAEKDKPSPIPLLAGMKQVNPDLTIQDILYIGDTETDLLTAKNAGCDVAFIQSDQPRPDLIETYDPAYAYHSLMEFLEAVTTGGMTTNRVAG